MAYKHCVVFPGAFLDNSEGFGALVCTALIIVAWVIVFQMNRADWDEHEWS